jgi:hypothetical protein
MASPAESAVPPLQNRPPQVPPLRIHHLMAWMTVTAVLISVCLWFDRWARNGPPISDQLIVVGLIISALVFAASLTCFGFAMVWRRHGYSFPQRPGDCLLLIMARSILFLAGAILGVFAIFMIVGDDDWLVSFYVVMCIIGVIAWLRSNAKLLAKYADTNAWCAAGLMLIAAPGLVIFVYVLAGFAMIGAIAPLLACLLWASYDDWRQFKQRSWTHWLGVFSAIILGVAASCVFHS